jgi:hypothetical protein
MKGREILQKTLKKPLCSLVFFVVRNWILVVSDTEPL